MTGPAVGVWSIGTYLPPIVRKNDWWSKEIVASWSQPLRENKAHKPVKLNQPDVPPGAALAMEAMKEATKDPFRGGLERRSMPNDMRSSDMETSAARIAIEKAGVKPEDIDFLVCQTSLPDFLNTHHPCKVHHNLGLRKDCLALSSDSVCNSFLHGMQIAQAFIKGGMGKIGLLVQSSALTHLVQQEDAHSPWFGDGAAAEVVGAVSQGRGVIGHTNMTDGSLFGSIVCGVAGKRWEEGTPRVYLENADRARALFWMMPDHAKELVGGALGQAQLPFDQVDFWACHQPTAWVGPLVQKYLGMTRAKTISTFPWTASIVEANLPFILEAGAKEGLLRENDVVALYSGAAGVTTSGMVMRWGR